MFFASLGIMQIVVFLIVAGLVVAAGVVGTTRERLVANRIRKLRQDGRDVGSTVSVTSTPSTKAATVVEKLLFEKGEGHEWLRVRFAEAGIQWTWAPTTYVVVTCVLAIFFATLPLLISRWGFLPVRYAVFLVIPAGAIGLYLPYVWIEQQRKRRHLLLRRAIPDFLDLMVACLGGGLSVPASLRQVSNELQVAHPALSREFGIALHELELGSTLDRALQQLAARTGLEELKMLRTFIQQTTKFGSTITDALAQMAEMLRVQREQQAEELAQKAAVKILFPTMLFIFPTVFVVLAAPAAIQIRDGLFASK